MIYDDILEETKVAIRNQYGDINDLPRELANTIVNTYYFFNLWYYASKGGEVLPRVMPESKSKEGINKGIKLSLYEQGELLSKIKFMPKIIEDIRKARKNATIFEYNLLVSIAIDTFKYDIRNAINMNVIIRSIVRFFSRNRVKEIPDLIDLLQ